VIFLGLESRRDSTASFESPSRCASDVTMQEPIAIMPRRISFSLSNIFIMSLHASNLQLKPYSTIKHLIVMLKGLMINSERNIHLVKKKLGGLHLNSVQLA
jgi:hypothetical protein